MPSMQRLPTIPGYELSHLLGGGPITAVYAGREIDSDRPCAVKVIRASCEDRETAIKLLQREARAALAVRHAQVVRVIKAAVTCPPYFLAMELLPGESLRARLQREFRIKPAEAVWIGRQTAEALAALHRAGFVHADVKPENARLVNDGTVVLIDLGFAHRPGENVALFRRGCVLGTANYLAPELCGPVPFEDFASDLFSLGVTLFELLTGRLPYPRGSVRQVFRRHECDPPAKLDDLVPGLPRALVGLVQRLLGHEPETRPTATQVVHQLIQLEIASLRRQSA